MRSSAKDYWIVGIVGAIFLVLICALVYWVANYAGTPEHRAPGVITRIDYDPAHTTGTGDNKTRHSAEWHIFVDYAGRDGRISTGWRPEGWKHQGAHVTAVYHIGRFDKSANLSKLERVTQ